MNKKYSWLASFLLTFFLGFVFVLTVSAQDGDIPERNGVYNVPGRPDLKVRVFVHGPKPEPTSLPVVSCTDPDSSAVVPGAGWHLPLSWTYRLNTSSVPSSVGSGNFSTIASNAYSAWSTAVNGKVSFNKGSDTTVDRKGYDGQNIVAWGRTSGTALAVTYTWYYTSTGEAAETDTIFNKKFAWSWTNPALFSCSQSSNTYDAQNILTHELGHWMGLDDTYDSSFADNTMYGYGAKGEIKKDTLTTGDKQGVSNIYH